MDVLLFVAWTVAGQLVLEIIDQEPVLPDVKSSLGPLRIFTG